MVDPPRAERRFLPFFRRYTKTWIHAVATAGLTAFGTLTFVNQGFAFVAVAVYVLPPVVLYLREGVPGARKTAGATPTEQNGGKSKEFVTDDDPEKRNDLETGGEADEQDERDAERPTWTPSSTSGTETLFDAAIAGNGAYAVGENGVVLRNDDDADDWEIVLEDGPGANAADLRGVDAMADGTAVWIAGDGGALGRIDAETGRHADYSAPSDITDNWTGLAVGGMEEDETILLANGSGQVLRGRYRDGDIAWDEPTKPGSGSSLCAAAMADASVGYLCDTNDGVFETDDGGANFRRIGIESVDGTLTDVAAGGGDDRCYVTTDDGICYRYADGAWTPNRLGDDALSALSMTDELAVACGGNALFERTDGNEWERIVVPADGELRGVAVGANRAVAVGAAGTVVERTR